MSRVNPGKPTPAPRGGNHPGANGTKPPWHKPDSPGNKKSKTSQNAMKNLQQGGKKQSNDSIYMNRINEFMRMDRDTGVDILTVFISSTYRLTRKADLAHK